MVFMVCYDGSPTARRIVTLAREHAQVWEAGLMIVKAVERDEPLRRAYIEMEERKLEDEIEAILPARDVPRECQLFISAVSPGEQLVNYARSEGVDQLFVGVERRSKVGKLIFGSTAQYIILNSPCPVVTLSGPRL